MSPVARLSLLAAALLPLAACGSSQETEDNANRMPTPVQTSSVLDDARIQVAVDVNGDGTPDIWNVYVAVDAEGAPIHDVERVRRWEYTDRRLVEKLVDTNFDGRIDVWRIYALSGRLMREQIDLDFDGIVDRTLHFDQARVARRELDTNGDGSMDEIRTYRQGQLHRIERDLTHTGEVDEWLFFREGELDRVGLSTDGDNVIDHWIRRPQRIAESIQNRTLAPPARVDCEATPDAEGCAAE